MVEVTKKGLIFKKTVVKHAGGTDTFSGAAKVTRTEAGVCVSDSSGLVSERTRCYLDPKPSSGQSSLPDGKVVGRSKSVAVQTNDGRTVEHKGSPTRLVSVQKQGSDMVVRETGAGRAREVGRYKADQVASVSSEDCGVCKAVNPYYDKKKS